MSLPIDPLVALEELADEAHYNGNSWHAWAEPRLELIKAAICAPVPPAGEVEVLGRVLYPIGRTKKVGGVRSLRSYDECKENAYPDAWREGEKLVDIAHVTRLTAENARLQAEVDNYKSQDECFCIEHGLHIQQLQSDLTKARELFESILNDHRLVVAMPSALLVPIKEFLAHQSAPAAKDAQ